MEEEYNTSKRVVSDYKSRELNSGGSAVSQKNDIAKNRAVKINLCILPESKRILFEAEIERILKTDYKSKEKKL